MKVKFPIIHKDSEVIGEYNIKNVTREDTPITRNGVRIEGFFVGDTKSDKDCAIWIKSKLPTSNMVFFESLYAEVYETPEAKPKKDWGIGIKESEDLVKKYREENGLVVPKPVKPKVAETEPTEKVVLEEPIKEVVPEVPTVETIPEEGVVEDDKEKGQGSDEL